MECKAFVNAFRAECSGTVSRDACGSRGAPAAADARYLRHAATRLVGGDVGRSALPRWWFTRRPFGAAWSSCRNCSRDRLGCRLAGPAFGAEARPLGVVFPGPVGRGGAVERPERVVVDWARFYVVLHEPQNH